LPGLFVDLSPILLPSQPFAAIGATRLLNPQQHLAIIQQNGAVRPLLMPSVTAVPRENLVCAQRYLPAWAIMPC
jgi:hypothetical protein